MIEGRTRLVYGPAANPHVTGQARGAAVKRAKNRALAALTSAHPAEYMVLLRAACEAEGITDPDVTELP